MTKLEMLGTLAEKVSGCEKCPDLVEGRLKTVFGEGNPNTRIVCVGEGPGKNESETGRPFIGECGQLLTEMLTSCGLKREDLFVLNILKCRPPNNRKPTDQECLNCRPFLEMQLKIINPEYIVCFGGVAAQNILKIRTPIGRLRGQWHKRDKIKVLCTYHPSFALRFRENKQEIIKDLQLLLADL